MTSEIINSIFFGLGIFLQVFLLIGFKKADLKEILKDIGGGIFFAIIFSCSSLESGWETDFNELALPLIYVFYIGFAGAYALSFKKRLLFKINETNLLVLNVIFIYYCVTRLGVDNWFTEINYISALLVLVLIMFKNKLKIFHKGLIYTWYVMLFVIISMINLFQPLKDNVTTYSQYLSSFFVGGIFLYLLIYIVYLIMFINIIDYVGDKNRPDVRRGRLELQEHFLDLANSFNETRISNLKILTLFIALFIFLIVNYYNNYISESLLIVFILFISSVSSVKKVDLAKKDIAREN